jgi:hypothetical protein
VIGGPEVGAVACPLSDGNIEVPPDRAGFHDGAAGGAGVGPAGGPETGCRSASVPGGAGAGEVVHISDGRAGRGRSRSAPAGVPNPGPGPASNPAPKPATGPASDRSE